MLQLPEAKVRQEGISYLQNGKLSITNCSLRNSKLFKRTLRDVGGNRWKSTCLRAYLLWRRLVSNRRKRQTARWGWDGKEWLHESQSISIEHWPSEYRISIIMMSSITFRGPPWRQLMSAEPSNLTQTRAHKICLILNSANVNWLGWRMVSDQAKLPCFFALFRSSKLEKWIKLLSRHLLSSLHTRQGQQVLFP
jgi:hypothetical protein